jgi:hypothetical protein
VHEARDRLDGGLGGRAAAYIGLVDGRRAALETGAMTTSMPSVAAR